MSAVLQFWSGYGAAWWRKACGLKSIILISYIFL